MTSTHTPPHIRMSNEIAVQFRRRDPAPAAQEIAAHIRAFWDPRMRAELIAAARAADERLDPLVVAAAALLPPVPAAPAPDRPHRLGGGFLPLRAVCGP